MIEDFRVREGTLRLRARPGGADFGRRGYQTAVDAEADRLNPEPWMAAPGLK